MLDVYENLIKLAKKFVPNFGSIKPIELHHDDEYSPVEVNDRTAFNKWLLSAITKIKDKGHKEKHEPKIDYL
jgi:hypothetical protein